MSGFLRIASNCCQVIFFHTGDGDLPHHVMQAGRGNAYFHVVGSVTLGTALFILLKQNGKGTAKEGMEIALFHSGSHFGGGVGTLFFDRTGHLFLHGGRRGAGAGRVGENVHGGKAAFLNKGQGLDEFFFGFPGETHDQVGGNGGKVKILPQQPHRFQITGGVVLAVHTL